MDLNVLSAVEMRVNFLNSQVSRPAVKTGGRSILVSSSDVPGAVQPKLFGQFGLAIVAYSLHGDPESFGWRSAMPASRGMRCSILSHEKC